MGQMGMPPMVNMNMMINNMMMGGGVGGGNEMDGFGQFMPFELMQHLQPRARVANQQNVDALPTDTYRVQTKAKANSNSNGDVDIDLTVDDEEEEKKDDEAEEDDKDR